jgi:hypothetical protein
MFIFRGGGYSEPGSLSPAELQRHLDKWNTWTNALLNAGRNAKGEPLSYPPAGKTIRGRDKLVTDGPYAESKDLVSGTLVLEAATLDEAAELARGCPILELDGSVEVRTVASPPPA